MLKKDKGSSGAISILYPLIIVIPTIVLILMLYIAETIKEEIHDDLTLSLMASAIIDIEEFGLSNNIIIKDIDESYNIFLETLRYNMNLDDLYYSKTNDFITGPIIIEQYYIYNVKNDIVTIYKYDQSGFSSSSGILGEIKDPKGNPIVETSIFGKIKFPISLFMGMTTNGTVTEIIGITKN